MYLEDKEYFLIEWGKPYLREIMAETSDDFNIYEIEFEMNDSGGKDDIPTRNLKLIQMNT